MWYLSFYCNPRIQLAVVSKILMEGLRASATLYGEFMEQYVYCELEVGEQEVEDRTKEQTSMIFNTERVFNLQFNHVPFIIPSM